MMPLNYEAHPESCLEGDKFILDGKAYTKDNLHKLPDKISSYNVSTKKNDDIVGFLAS